MRSLLPSEFFQLFWVRGATCFCESQFLLRIEKLLIPEQLIGFKSSHTETLLLWTSKDKRISEGGDRACEDVVLSSPCTRSLDSGVRTGSNRQYSHFYQEFHLGLMEYSDLMTRKQTALAQRAGSQRSWLIDRWDDGGGRADWKGARLTGSAVSRYFSWESWTKRRRCRSRCST